MIIVFTTDSLIPIKWSSILLTNSNYRKVLLGIDQIMVMSMIRVITRHWIVGKMIQDILPIGDQGKHRNLMIIHPMLAIKRLFQNILKIPILGSTVPEIEKTSMDQSVKSLGKNTIVRYRQRHLFASFPRCPESRIEMKSAKDIIHYCGKYLSYTLERHMQTKHKSWQTK